jgi:hypothetical protein
MVKRCTPEQLATLHTNALDWTERQTCLSPASPGTASETIPMNQSNSFPR